MNRKNQKQIQKRTPSCPAESIAEQLANLRLISPQNKTIVEYLIRDKVQVLVDICAVAHKAAPLELVK